jgi:hypothetical protein
MALQLQITFIGLFTFVQKDRMTYALLPPTVGHMHAGGAHRGAAPNRSGGGHIPAHEARVFLGSPDVVGQKWPMPWSLPLDGMVLRISDAERPAGGPAPFPPDQLLDLTDLSGGARVQPGALASPPDAALLHARVDLDLYGSIDTRAKTRFAIPDAGGAPVEVIRETYTVWTDTVRPGALSITLVPIGGGPELPLVTPTYDPATVDDANAVALTIYHVVPEDLPPNVPAPHKGGAEITHFDAYYATLAGAQRTPKPKFVRSEEPPGRGGEPGSCPNTTAKG